MYVWYIYIHTHLFIYDLYMIDICIFVYIIWFCIYARNDIHIFIYTWDLWYIYDIWYIIVLFWYPCVAQFVNLFSATEVGAPSLEAAAIHGDPSGREMEIKMKRDKCGVTPWKFNSSPLKISHIKTKVIFQPSYFRGHVKLRGYIWGTLPWMVGSDDLFPFGMASIFFRCYVC